MGKSKKIAGLRFILNQECNYNCIYCHKENLIKPSIPSKKMNEILVEHTIEEMAKRGAKIVAITGGEPFLSRDLFKLLKLAKKHGRYTIVNTNGSVFGANIKDIGLINEIHVHLPSLNSNIYGKITGNEKTLGRVLESLFFLKKKSKIKIFLNIPVVRDINESELRKIYKFGEKNGFKCRFLEVFPVSKKLLNYYVDINKVIKKYFPEFKKISTYGYGISKYKNSSGKMIYTCRCMCFDERCNKCFKSNYIHITPNMKLKPCSLRETMFLLNFNKISLSIDKCVNFLDGMTCVPAKYNKLFQAAKDNN